MHTYIHVGPHKTGSTAIQSTFWHNRNLLLKEGALYPTSCKYHFAQHRLSFALKGMSDPTKGDIPDFISEFSQLQGEVKAVAPSKLVVSSEEFFGLPLDRVQRIAQAFGTENTTIIAFVRNPVDSFLSVYNQNTKDPASPFKMHIRAAAEKAVKLFPYLHFSNILSRWEQVFGSDKIRLVEYGNGTVVEDFCNEIGLSQTLSTSKAVANRSVDARALEIIRLAKHADLSLEERRKVASVAFKYYASVGIRHDLKPGELVNLAETLCPLYDDVFLRYFNKENPYSAEHYKDAEPERPLRIGLELVRLLADNC